MPTVFITGASRGLGHEFARQYAQAGWRVIAACRDSDCAERLAGLPAIELHALDVADFGMIKALAKKLEGRPIDLLLCNAGQFGGAQEFGQAEPEDFLETLSVNLVAPLMLAHAFVGPVEAGKGRLMAFMSSRMGSMADNSSGGYYIYRASKAGLNAVVKSLSVDLEARGVKAVALHPGWVRTDMGGPAAPLTPEESVACLRKVIDNVTSKHSGKFLNYDGKEIPW